MTVNQACRILRVSSFATFSQKHQAYLAMQKRLSAKLMPGNPLEERKKTRQNWLNLPKHGKFCKQIQNSRYILKAIDTKKTKTPIQITSYPKPQTLAEACEQMTDNLPFKIPVIVTMLIVTFLLIIIGLVSNL